MCSEQVAGLCDGRFMGSVFKCSQGRLLVKLNRVGKAEGSGQPDTRDGTCDTLALVWFGFHQYSELTHPFFSFSDQGTCTAESALVRTAKGYAPKIPF